MLAVAFAACENPSGGGGGGGGGEQPDPAHTHNWGAWAATDIAGTKERVCKSNSSHIEHRLTGTGRFTFELISGAAAYRVSQGTAIAGTVRIPAYYRPSAENEYQPVTAIRDDSSIYNGAFHNCTSLINIIIPESVTSIGRYAFSYCTSLTSIAIPAGVMSIGNDAFTNCGGLTSITVAASNPNYTGDGGILYNKAKTLLIKAPPAGINGTVTIPAGVTEIGTYAFSGCSNLASINIPASVTFIDRHAFSYCHSLTSITIPASVATIGYSTFYGWTNTQTINVPFANADAKPAGWATNWNGNCNATIKYWNGSAWV